jgi:hypothetical protein
MRTTVDIPDDLYRTLKARAALSGVTMRELIVRLIEQSLRRPVPSTRKNSPQREPPPVVVPPRGVQIPAVSRADLRRIEEEEDEHKHARSLGR